MTIKDVMFVALVCRDVHDELTESFRGSQGVSQMSLIVHVSS